MKQSNLNLVKSKLLDVSNLAAIAECNDSRPIAIDQLKIISDEVSKAKLTATKSKQSNKEDFELIQIEISDLLKKGILRCPTFPW